MTLSIGLSLAARPPEAIIGSGTSVASYAVAVGIVLITGMIVCLYYLWAQPRKDRRNEPQG
jgi:hypothetical protein